jgi:hypothetical protein
MSPDLYALKAITAAWVLWILSDWLANSYMKMDISGGD